MVLSDCHCHLDVYRPEQLSVVLEQARARQVGLTVSMGMTLKSSEDNIRIAGRYKQVLAAIGIHPWNAVTPTDEIRRQLHKLAGSKQVVAIGEIGLDYIRSTQSREIQKELLIYELSLAQERGLPVSLHCREAHQDMMHILRKETGPDLKGKIHGFSGDLAALRDWLDLGFYVSIGIRGFVINQNPSLHEAVHEIPSDRLLIETDSSATAEMAGPADVLLVAQELASYRKTTVEDIANTTTANLKRLLGIRS